MAYSTARAFWVTAPGKGELRDEPLPEPKDGELLVRSCFSAISRGTESLVWNGQVPESQYQRMRAPFQAGDFPAPVKYGYCNIGVVEAGPEPWPGQRIFSLYPHQERFVLPVRDAHPLPPGLAPERAVLAANTETALNACWDASPLAGERISVVGAGVVGCLTAALCAAVPGTEVELIDINPQRRRIAERLGIAFAEPTRARSGADRVVHASASESGAALALSLAADEATIVELSWYGQRAVRLPLGEDFHSRRLTLKSSQVGQLAAAQRPRWDHQRRLQKALELLAANPAWEVLIDGESQFADLPRVMASVAAGDALCHRIRYSESSCFLSTSATTS
ncbi:dehydrogenase [Spiribacter pallidus]|uniref:Dehydrogenase n=1 Tax=Spiribacter pallidus TaxID=1987936 RepID=A0ABV3TCH7_9GAMM